MSAIDDYRAADEARDAAWVAVRDQAAAWIEEHPEADQTGEWARLKALPFLGPVKNNWVVEVEDDVVSFERTTVYGRDHHRIVVPIAALTETTETAEPTEKES